MGRRNRSRQGTARSAAATLLLAAAAGCVAWGLGGGEDADTGAVHSGESSDAVAVGAGRVLVIWTHETAMRAAEMPAPGESTVGRAIAHAPSQAFRDPVTGRWTAPREGARVAAGPRREITALSTSAEGLVEEPVEGSRGGVRVSLRGRFRSEVTALRGPEGVRVGCDAHAGPTPETVPGEGRAAAAEPDAGKGGGR